MLSANTGLLVLHGVAAGVLVGATIHNALLSWRAWVRGLPTNIRLQRLYPAVIAWAWALTLILGLVIYPAFRTGPRAEVFDVYLPLLTGIFEVKEHWLGLGTLLLLYLVPSSRHLGAASELRTDHSFYHLACLLLGLIVAWAALTGLTLTAVEPL